MEFIKAEGEIELKDEKTRLLYEAREKE